MARKATSAKVSKLAAKLIQGHAIDGDVRAAVADAITANGLVLNERAVNATIDRIIAALEPHFDDVRTLAASCLSQDETPGDAQP
jgi:hypothetical protein